VSIERREFLTASLLGAATLVAQSQAQGQLPVIQDPPKLPGVKWDKAPCRFCGTGCHVQVGVRDGKVVAVQGDQRAEVNKGLLCVKGYHVPLALYGKDRLTEPLLREGDKYVPISWERAIKIIADRVQLGDKGFAMYGSGQWTIPEGYGANKFMKAGLGSNQIDPNARLCMASAVTGYLATYGVDEPSGCYDDLDACDVLITWGNNPAEMHPVLFSRVMDRRSRGEPVRFIDMATRHTRSSAFADETLLFKPQGDLAIANGILHLLLEQRTYDEAFVREHCAFKADSEPKDLHGKPISFDEFKASLKKYTPDYCAQLSGVPAAKIRMLAELFGRRELKIVSTWCMGMNQHTQGTAINTLVHGVHLLSGHFGRPGDAPMSLTGQPSACGTVREVGTLAHALPGGLLVAKPEDREKAEKIWNVPHGRIPAKPGYHTVDLWQKFGTPKEQGGDIHTVWVQVTNPGQTLPNSHALVDPSRKLKDKFLIVSDVYPTATTRIADLILPSAMWVEKNGMVGNSERRTQQWFKMVSPPGKARDDLWQIVAVARELFERGHEGMRDNDGRFLFHIEKDGKAAPIWDYAHYYDVNVDEHLFEEYRKFTRYKHKDLAPYAEYVKARGLRWPVVQQKSGEWRETRFRFSGFDDPYCEGKKIRFYHSPTKDDRAQVWFRPYVAPPEEPDAEFPLWLCTGRVLEHWHSGSMTMRIPQLRGSMPRAYVELHRDDARRFGVRDGEIVRIESRRGFLDLPVWIDGRGKPPPGSVFVPFFDESLPINRVTLEAHDFFSKQPDYKKCAVRLKRLA